MASFLFTKGWRFFMVKIKSMDTKQYRWVTGESVMNTKLICRILIILALFSLLVACDSTAPTPQKKKELLIYCGITMVKPVRELADSFEKQENCIVKIMIGGSGTLYRIIEVNQVGDLYLPGSESYINKTFASGSTIQTKLVGYNRAALVVAKGNPLEISPNISNLTSNEYRVVLGSPDSGSIGKETKNILSRFDLYEQAVDNSLFLTSDSKGLRQAIVENTANLALNWYATTVWQENKESMEALSLAEGVAPKHQLIIGLLKYSKEPELAKRLFDFIGSDAGKKMFIHYGFGQE